MDITCDEQSDMLFARVEAERIDAAAALQFKEAMREIAGASGAAHVVLDLSRVEFVDSSGLGAIVAVMKLMGNTKRLDLAGLTPTVDKVFRLTRMDSIFTIHADVADALALHRAG
ncbi:anti-sigma factor antagonist [Rhodobacteraceae bacterium 63075]|nr:anti-sigma factor antagonist [Rhodobacteraceae bacterium 63075]